MIIAAAMRQTEQTGATNGWVKAACATLTYAVPAAAGAALPTSMPVKVQMMDIPKGMAEQPLVLAIPRIETRKAGRLTPNLLMLPLGAAQDEVSVAIDQALRRALSASTSLVELL